MASNAAVKVAPAQSPSVTQLVVSLSSDQPSRIYKALVDIRTKILKEKDGIVRIRQRGGIQKILNVLQGDHCKTIDVALSILGNCCMDQAFRNQVHAQNGVSVIGDVLKSTESASLQNRACRTLANMALDPRCCQTIHEEEGLLERIVDLLKQSSDPECEQTFLRATRVLADTPEHRKTLLALWALKAAVVRLSSQTTGVATVALKTVAYFIQEEPTDQCMHQVVAGDGFTALLALAEDPEATRSRMHTAQSLILAAVKHASFRPALGNSGLVGFLVRIINHRYQDQSQESSDPARTFSFVNALCLACQESLNRIRIREEGGLKLFLNLLNQDRFGKIHNRILSALLCFLYDEPSMDILLSGGLVDLLLTHLSRCSTLAAGPGCRPDSGGSESRKLCTGIAERLQEHVRGVLAYEATGESHAMGGEQSSDAEPTADVSPSQTPVEAEDSSPSRKVVSCTLGRSAEDELENKIELCTEAGHGDKGDGAKTRLDVEPDANDDEGDGRMRRICTKYSIDSPTYKEVSEWTLDQGKQLDNIYEEGVPYNILDSANYYGPSPERPFVCVSPSRSGSYSPISVASSYVSGSGWSSPGSSPARSGSSVYADMLTSPMGSPTSPSGAASLPGSPSQAGSPTRLRATGSRSASWSPGNASPLNFPPLSPVSHDVTSGSCSGYESPPTPKDVCRALYRLSESEAVPQYSSCEEEEEDKSEQRRTLNESPAGENTDEHSTTVMVDTIATSEAVSLIPSVLATRPSSSDAPPGDEGIASTKQRDEDEIIDSRKNVSGKRKQPTEGAARKRRKRSLDRPAGVDPLEWRSVGSSKAVLLTDTTSQEDSTRALSAGFIMARIPDITEETAGKRSRLRDAAKGRRPSIDGASLEGDCKGDRAEEEVAVEAEMKRSRGQSHDKVTESNILILLSRISYIQGPTDHLCRASVIEILVNYLLLCQAPFTRAFRIINRIFRDPICMDDCIRKGLILIVTLAHSFHGNRKGSGSTEGDKPPGQSKSSVGSEATARGSYQGSGQRSRQGEEDCGGSGAGHQEALVGVFRALSEGRYGRGVVKHLLARGDRDVRLMLYFLLPLLYREFEMLRDMCSLWSDGFRLVLASLSKPHLDTTFTLAVTFLSEAACVLGLGTRSYRECHSDLDWRASGPGSGKEDVVPGLSRTGRDVGTRLNAGQTQAAAVGEVCEKCAALGIEGMAGCDDEGLDCSLHVNTGLDVTFALDDGGRVMGNRDRLMYSSSVFAAMFGGSFVESQRRTVPISGASTPAFRALVRYIQKQPMDEPLSSRSVDWLEVALELLALSDRFLMRSLHCDISSQLLRTVERQRHVMAEPCVAAAADCGAGSGGGRDGLERDSPHPHQHLVCRVFHTAVLHNSGWLAEKCLASVLGGDKDVSATRHLVRALLGSASGAKTDAVVAEIGRIFESKFH